MAKKHRIIPALTDKDIARFWSKVDRREPHDCWPWKAARVGRPDGYGLFSIRHCQYGAHRIAWTIAHGSGPGTLLVLHHCDNPPCVNPLHLWVGTQADNIHDAMTKGRLRPAHGERHGKTTLLEADVRMVRYLCKHSGRSERAIARRLGIPKSTVNNIARRHSWKHLQ